MKKLIFTLSFLSTTLFVFGQNVLLGGGAGDIVNSAGGNKNVFLGINAGYKSMIANENVFVGQGAGYNNMTGDNNVFLGFNAGVNTLGNNNVFLGYKAGYNETGSNKLYISNGTGGTGPLIYGDFSTGNIAINTTNATIPLTILGNGGTSVVGITQNQVGGTATMEFTTSDGISAQATRLLLRGGTPNAPIEFYRGKRGEEVMSMIIDIEGNVGIGTAAPKSKLHVAGGYYGRGDIRLYAHEGDGNNGTAYFQARDDSGTSNINLQFRAQKNGTNFDLMRLTSDGNIGIGTKTPDQKLSVNGNASKTGGGSWATFSDVRTKKNISGFKDGLDVVLQMNPVRFQYNGTAGYPETGKEYVGVIAQEIKKYAPYMIETVAKKLRETDEKETDLLMYDSSALAYILVNAVKEQQKIIATQQQKIEALENRVADTAAKESLQQRIKALEALVAEMTEKGSEHTLHAAVDKK